MQFLQAVSAIKGRVKKDKFNEFVLRCKEWIKEVDVPQRRELQ